MKITIDLDKLETFDSFKRRYVLQNGKPITKQCLNNWIVRGVVKTKEFKDLTIGKDSEGNDKYLTLIIKDNE